MPFFHVYGLSLIGVAVRFVSTISVLPRFDPVTALDVMEGRSPFGSHCARCRF